MRKISVIGAGPAGLIFTYALLRKGYDVTVYSDKTPDQWLNHCPPTGTAYLYGAVIDIERELGMDFWSDTMFEGGGVLMDFKPEIEGEVHVEVAGSFQDRGGAIDQRLRVSRWLEDLEKNGGNLVIESVTPDRLDEIALDSDLTVLAAGKADLSASIPRHAERSVYDKPQRNLCMAIVEGVEGWGSKIDFRPVKFNFYGDSGEYFWVPYTHKTAGATWCVLFEAKPGGALDIFGDVTSGEEAVARMKPFIKKHAPWEWDLVKNMTFVTGDPYGWLKGRFPPTVRQGVGRLPSGGLVMPIGDTSVAFDPIGGQGGNHASRNALYMAQQVLARGQKAFDADWMEQINDSWWEDHGQYAYRFNNILLEPLTEAGTTFLMQAAQDRGFADQHFFGNFPKTKCFFPEIEDVDKAQALVAGWKAGTAEQG